MGCLGNLLWLLFGGLATAFEYFTAGLVLCLTVVGIPWGLQAFKLGVLALWPFGSHVEEVPGSGGCLDTLMNVIWFFIGGFTSSSPMSSLGACSTSPLSASPGGR